MPLFTGGVKRPASNKASLKNFLLDKVSVNEPNESKGEVDGGALLWSCMWSKHEKFDTIIQKYISKCKNEKYDVIVFDGYCPSTKDVSHQSKIKKISQVVEVKVDNLCPSDRTDFFIKQGE